MDGKSENYAQNEEDQIIQPYLDKEIFFSEQWIFSEYVTQEEGTPGSFFFRARPPENWTLADQQRARKHFSDFSLAKRYATKSAEQLSTIIHQVRSLQAYSVAKDAIIESIFETAINTAAFPNHWQRPMHQALKEKFIADNCI